ncbi:MAG TPA: hypothetical protein VF698_14775 [Thermoanaerobaculia bacterium]|jgi:hypothetical protein
MRQFVRSAAIVFALAAASASAGTPQVSFVPWKVLNRGDKPIEAPLVLYWIPASRDEIRRSELVTSRALTMYASQCVGMQLIRPDDTRTIENLGASEKLPIAILLAGDGEELGRVEPHRGTLSEPEVAELVRDALGEHEAHAELLLDEAKEKAASGETEAAIVLYRRVWDERCVCPRQGKAAQRALKKLGALR